MSIVIGLDIGGTKIAGAAFDREGRELGQVMLPTPAHYESFLTACAEVVHQLETQKGRADSLGAGIRGVFDRRSGVMKLDANVPYLSGMPLHADLQRVLNRSISMENDANCAALAEAIEGSGKGRRAVFSLIMGTGVGGGYVVDGNVFAGANGLCGEIGHLPLPYYEQADGERVVCGCGQKGCIEKLIAGAALARLYEATTGAKADARSIASLAQEGNTDALRVLDHYYTIVAKAMVTILHSFDPDIITVSGGLNALPGLYTEVPKRWGRYAVSKEPVTEFVPAAFGAMAGLRGAALLGQTADKNAP